MILLKKKTKKNKGNDHSAKAHDLYKPSHIQDVEQQNV